MFDMFVTAIAEEVIRRRGAPGGAFYVHICKVDNAKHYHGLHSPEVATALENTDRLLGRLLKALQDARLLAQTNIVLCSDHGQLPVTRISWPNRFLRERGLLVPTADGVSAWRMQVHSACLSAFVYTAAGQDGDAAVRLFSAPDVKCAAWAFPKSCRGRRLWSASICTVILPPCCLAATAFTFATAYEGPWLAPAAQAAFAIWPTMGTTPPGAKSPSSWCMGRRRATAPVWKVSG